MRSVGYGWENIIPHASKRDAALHACVFHPTGQLFLVVVKGDVMIICLHPSRASLYSHPPPSPPLDRVGFRVLPRRLRSSIFFYIPTRPLCLAFASDGVEYVCSSVHSSSGGVRSASALPTCFEVLHFIILCYLINAVLLSKVYS